MVILNAIPSYQFTSEVTGKEQRMAAKKVRKSQPVTKRRTWKALVEHHKKAKKLQRVN